MTYYKEKNDVLKDNLFPIIINNVSPFPLFNLLGLLGVLIFS